MDDLSYYRDYDIKTLYQILEINKNNLQLLQQRHVLYGALHAPLPLINEINQIISTVRFITRIIQEKERVRYSQTISKDIVAKADIISKHKFHQLMSMLINLTNASAILAQNLRIMTDKIKKNDQQSVISALDKSAFGN